MAAPTFHGVATGVTDGATTTPVDGDTVTITPPASMLAGDLVVVRMSNENGSVGDGKAVNNTGGQTWTTDTTANSYEFAGAAAGHKILWCTFNGTWSANPSFNFPALAGTRAVEIQMLVFRPDSTSKTWSLDTATAWASYTAPSTPFTVTITAGYTPANNDNVSIAGWGSDDNNTWDSLSGTGWSQTGLGAQYRTTVGSDISTTYAYLLQGTKASVPNVSQNQATLGGDAGATFIVTFYAAEPPTFNPGWAARATTIIEGAF